MKKKSFLMLPCIAAVAIVTLVGKKTFESHAYETSSLLMQNVEALSLSTGEGSDNLWFRSDGDCEYTLKGKAGTETVINLGVLGNITLKFDADGVASYTAQNARTDCEADGRQQCEARYCPAVLWQ